MKKVMYYDNISMSELSGNYLSHHGVMGMKWGIRRYQPYSTVPRKSGKEGKEIGTAASKHISKVNSNTKGSVFKDNAYFSNPDDAYIIEAEERVKPDGSLIYPPVAKVIGDFLREKGENPYPGDVGFDGLYERVNPDYGEPGTTNNCPFVGATMEIASRGFDVVARRSLGGASAGCFTKWFTGAQNEICQDFSEMKQDIVNDGNGSSGVLQGYYGDGLGSGMGGHTLHYRNENGNIIVADGQNHNEYSFDDIIDTYGFNPGKCIRTRLDNCEPNWDALAADGVIGVNNDARRWRSRLDGTVYDRF